MQILSEFYAVDLKYLYESFKGTRKKITGSARLVDERCSCYVADEKNVYYYSSKVKNAQPSSFRALKKMGSLGHTDYFKDNNQVYIYGKAIKEADSFTFELVEIEGSNLDAIDKNHAYSGKNGSIEFRTDHIIAGDWQQFVPTQTKNHLNDIFLVSLMTFVQAHIYYTM